MIYINADDVLKKYPYLINTLICKNRNKLFYMYAFHIEHIVMCIMKLKKKLLFKYVWIIEQDLGFSGNINYFFRKYERSKKDIVTTKYYQNNRGWYFCCTNNYMKYRYKKLNGTGYKTSEHIQRWSIKYIDMVEKLLKKNIHSQSEHGSIEFALFNNLSVGTFDSDDFGYKYRWNSIISIEEWNKIHNNSMYRNKLFHALKFL